MSGYSYAFISYQTADRAAAGILKVALARVGILAFLAHEDIEVSEEWRRRILEEIRKADLFICLLSQAYLKSSFCIQESGIAAYRDDLVVIPLLLDGTVPPGFIGNVQSAKVAADKIDIEDITPGLVKRNLEKGLHTLIQIVRTSSTYRLAEKNFDVLFPYLNRLTREQGKLLLKACVDNDQVHNASRCARDHIPKVIALFGTYGDIADVKFLEETCRI